jgi:hypothetical protein
MCLIEIRFTDQEAESIYAAAGPPLIYYEENLGSQETQVSNFQYILFTGALNRERISP